MSGTPAIWHGPGPRPSRLLISGHVDHMDVAKDKIYMEEGFFLFKTSEGIATHCILPKDRKQLVERNLHHLAPLVNQNQSQVAQGAPENRSTSINFMGDNVCFNTSKFEFGANDMGVLVHPLMLLRCKAFSSDPEYEEQLALVKSLYAEDTENIIIKHKNNNILYPLLTLPLSQVQSAEAFLEESFLLRDKFSDDDGDAQKALKKVYSVTSPSIPFTTAATKALTVLSLGGGDDLLGQYFTDSDSRNPLAMEKMAMFLKAYDAYKEAFKPFRWTQDCRPAQKKGLQFCYV